MRPLPCLGLTAALLAIVGPAHAARSYDNCTGFIESLPTTLNTQGTWCLRRDLATSIASGTAITVEANNVTIDCNDFKLGGLAAGSGTNATGIRTVNRQNVTVRNCSIRGFFVGAALTGEESNAHVIEDNRFDNNTFSAIRLDGTGSVARRNLITNTGVSTFVLGLAIAVDLLYGADAIDNTIDGVVGQNDAGNSTAVGIRTSISFGGSITGNRIRGLRSSGTGAVRGILNETIFRVNIRGNDLAGNGSGSGIACSEPRGLAKDNLISDFATPIDGCIDAGGNASSP